MSRQQQRPIAITNADSFLGYVLAFRFLEGRRQEQAGQQQEVRLLVRNRQNLDELERMGAKLIQTDYNDQQRLQTELQNVSLLLLVPENSQNTRQQGENVIRAARQANVQYITLFSMLSAEQAQEQQQAIRALGQLEEQVEQQYHDNYSVIRNPIFNQIFYYLTPMIEDRNRLELPVGPERKWSSVDVRDVAEAVYRLSRQNGPQQGVFFGNLGEQRLRQFTGRAARNGQEIAREYSQALNREEQVQYRQIQPQELENYLNGIRDDQRFSDRPRERAGGDDEKNRRDRPHSFPLGRFLNQEFIRLIVEFYGLADRGNTELTTNDLQQALGRQPQELREYFENNRDNFNRLR
ncbi:hypothetical protein BJV82DRAFT_583409 [Fennellomyces sp. T-0311]|nr:hypothetical protein BJV82DRAFT_583409 [Fennellomyces sp. T-0311]